MISHKHKFIFVHINKTGGKSIELALGADLSELHGQPRHVKHGTPHQWKYPKYWNTYFTFTFVRNPWSRAVSAYFFYLKRTQSKQKYLSASRQNGFTEFILQNPEFLKTKSSSMVDSLTHYIFTMCQMDWIVSDYDFIGRFENLQEDFNVVCDKIGIPKQQLPHKNKSKHKHYTEYYDDETKQIVAEKYAKDIEYFGYKFGE